MLFGLTKHPCCGERGSRLCGIAISSITLRSCCERQYKLHIESHWNLCYAWLNYKIVPCTFDLKISYLNMQVGYTYLVSSNISSFLIPSLYILTRLYSEGLYMAICGKFWQKNRKKF